MIDAGATCVKGIIAQEAGAQRPSKVGKDSKWQKNGNPGTQSVFSSELLF